MEFAVQHWTPFAYPGPRTEVIISWLNISKKPHAGSNPSEASGPHKREHGSYTHTTEARFGSGSGKAYIHYNAIKIPRAKPRATRTLILRPAAPTSCCTLNVECFVDFFSQSRSALGIPYIGMFRERTRQQHSEIKEILYAYHVNKLIMSLYDIIILIPSWYTLKYMKSVVHCCSMGNKE